jgi:GT2 family glycosyltransferase
MTSRDGPTGSITVSLVTFNAMPWLAACVASVLAQSQPPAEIVVIDNGSTDGTRDWLTANLADRSDTRIVFSETNLGYAGGHNRAIANARQDYILLLNQDVILDEAFIARVVGVLDADHTLGAVQAKVLQLMPGLERTRTIDTTGLESTRGRWFRSRGQGRDDDGAFDAPAEVFGADGPAPVYRRSALETVREPRHQGGSEVLDEDFFMYKEDIDLAWRLRLFRWRTAYAPGAVAWHSRTAGANGALSMAQLIQARQNIPGWIKGRSWANQRLMQLKNELPAETFRDLPWIAWKELRALGYLVMIGPARAESLRRLVAGAPGAIRKRRSIMARRTATGSELRVWFR